MCFIGLKFFSAREARQKNCQAYEAHEINFFSGAFLLFTDTCFLDFLEAFWGLFGPPLKIFDLR